MSVTNADYPAIKAFINSTAGQAMFAGKSDAAIAAALNDPSRQTVNPAPVPMIPLTSIPKQNLEIVMIGHMLAVVTLKNTQGATPAQLAFCDYFFQKLSYFQSSSITNVPIDVPLMTDLNTMKSNGIITDADIAAYTNAPDPSYQHTINGGPLAFQVLGREAYIATADVTAAKAS